MFYGRSKTTDEPQPAVKKATNNGVSSHRSPRAREPSAVPVGIDYAEVHSFVTLNMYLRNKSMLQRQSLFCFSIFNAESGWKL